MINDYMVTVPTNYIWLSESIFNQLFLDIEKKIRDNLAYTSQLRTIFDFLFFPLIKLFHMSLVYLLHLSLCLLFMSLLCA